jgi:TRAP-type C4-dicarboxylate transport system substrate-binding protein
VAEKLFNTKILAVGTNPPQVVWCRVPISGLSDLKGKKVRVFNKTMTDFVQAVGASAVSMAFAEVVPALQRGVVDCAVTGTMSGFTAGWTEVATHQFQVYMGWSINYQSVNLNSWNRFGPELQKFFLEQFAKLEDNMWETGAEAVAGADNCNFGTGCKTWSWSNGASAPARPTPRSGTKPSARSSAWRSRSTSSDN